jgi:hypothetical protein
MAAFSVSFGRFDSYWLLQEIVVFAIKLLQFAAARINKNVILKLKPFAFRNRL